MGKSGPPPTPTAILAARGSWRAAGREGEPQSPVCVPECPPWVNESARPWWAEIAGQLAEMGVMTAPNRVPLGLLVDALADYLAASKELSEQGMTFKTDKGYVGQHPAVSIRVNAWERLLKVCKEFGLTPASRTSVRMVGGKEKPEDNKSRFFKAKTG